MVAEVKNGDWVKIDFTGKVKSTGEIFDLTSADEAKRLGVHDPKKNYGPVLVILGAGMIMPGVEREMLGMEAGESRDFDLMPGEAMGLKRQELIRVVSMAKFIHEKITPFPGLWITIDGRNAKVQAVSGGRVRVDFNHPLAGKEISYHLKITEHLTDAGRMVAELLDYYGIKAKADIAGKDAVIVPEKDAPPFIRKIIGETLKRWCPGIESVRFGTDKEKAEGQAEKAAPPGTKDEPAAGRSQ